jgi:hypothetical protein
VAFGLIFDLIILVGIAGLLGARRPSAAVGVSRSAPSAVR